MIISKPPPLPHCFKIGWLKGCSPACHAGYTLGDSSDLENMRDYTLPLHLYDRACIIVLVLEEVEVRGSWRWWGRGGGWRWKRWEDYLGMQLRQRWGVRRRWGPGQLRCQGSTAGTEEGGGLGRTMNYLKPQRQQWLCCDSRKSSSLIRSSFFISQS